MRSEKMKAHWADPAYRARMRSLAYSSGRWRDVLIAHKWQSLCPCGASKVCRWCGVGEGTIPCLCMGVGDE